MSSVIHPHERAVLAHAVTQMVADRAQIRVLHVKGAVSRVQFPERRGVSGDVDVLVEPGHVDRFVSGLVEVGWTLELVSSDADLTNHAIILASDVWGVTVDVHRHFPGFDDDDVAVFERLWARRTAVDLAGRSITCPDRAAHAVILGLHAVRESASSGKAREAAALWAGLTPTELADAIAVAEETGAAPRLRIRLPEHFDATTGNAGLYWQVRSQNPNGTALWIARLRDERSWVQRMRILSRAVVPTAPALTHWSWRERLARVPGHWLKGLRQLVPAVKQLRRLR